MVTHHINRNNPHIKSHAAFAVSLLAICATYVNSAICDSKRCKPNSEFHVFVAWPSPRAFFTFLVVHIDQQFKDKVVLRKREHLSHFTRDIGAVENEFPSACGFSLCI